MGWEAWLSVVVTLLALGLVALTRIGPDLALLSALVLLLVVGVLDPTEALAGFAHEATITIGSLFVVAGGLRETGAISVLANRLLGRPTTTAVAQIRVMGPVAIMSGFVNNTPLVSVMLPAIVEWAKKHSFPVSKLLLPMSYASILGGMCTLIGTNTNLLINGMLGRIEDGRRLGMFEPAWIGLPCAVVGLIYMVVFSRWLLPTRESLVRPPEDAREYTVEMLVSGGSSLVGRTIEEAGLRHLSGLYLMEIDREGQVLPAVSSQERLKEQDRLVFVGVVESIVELQRIRGLTPATDQVFKLDAPRATRTLIEAVVSASCPLVGTSIREGRFRAVYNAAVIAVGRSGTRLRQKIGDIILRAGDTLLLEAHGSFVDQQKNSRDFFLVSQVANSRPPRHERAWLAFAILVGLVASVSLGWTSMLKGSMVAAGLMLLTRCCTKSEARANINWQVLVAIAAALGLGQALQVSGAAGTIAAQFVAITGHNPLLTLIVLYGLTLLFTELMTNIAAAVLVFPLAIASAESLVVDSMPLVIAVMVAASASFITPIGYHVNLMVFGPGGYRFADYARIGVPLSLLIWLVTALLTPVVWPF